MRGRREIEQCNVTETEGGYFSLKGKVTCELRIEGENRARQEEIWGVRVPMRRNRKCTDPEAVPTWPVPSTKEGRVARIREGKGLSEVKLER